MTARAPKERGAILFAGQAYYNAWYLSRALRELGWRADVLNWDPEPANQIFYHGEDIRLDPGGRFPLARHLAFYQSALRTYDILHFSNMNGMKFSPLLENFFTRRFSRGAELRLAKRLGKKIVYTNNGCHDGVSKTSFASWGERPVCDDCVWRNVPSVCSDEGNLAWGAFRNELADYQILLGGNRADYNVDPTVHEVPGFFCLDETFWHPDMLVPTNYRLPIADSTVKVYQAVGNMQKRTDPTGRNIKSTHIWVPLIEQLKAEGHDIDLVFFRDVPNTELRYYQVQADIVVDMLTYGWFGATVREALMLGKPVICNLRDEWLDQMRAEIPEYVDELPVVSATPETAREVLLDLVEHPEKRAEIGRRSREFAVKWHSARSGAAQLDPIYRELLAS
jgi:glycosyltransferase involved in cell wall biosynthesis